MPRYEYRCTACEKVSTIYHPSCEVETVCPKCDSGSTLIKLLTRFATSTRRTANKKAGTLTEEFIEDSKRELRQQRDKLEKER
jgi:putative FmdB family regulatory protein